MSDDIRSLNGTAPALGDLTSDASPFHVVGIGASAGGLEALERLFEGMPPDSGLAFVVVQHLSPDFKSLTDEILARRTSIPIYRVENGMEVRPNALFLLPPRKDMIVSGGRLLLTDKEPVPEVSLPIDHFFRSLAQDLGPRAVAIILSGTGSDGSRGVRHVRAAGGLVLAQSPETAKFDGMPRSAVETGAVHLALPVEEIPDALLRHVQHPAARAAKLPEPDADPAGMGAIFRLLRDGHGIDFTQYRPETVARRVERRLALGEFASVEEYARRLSVDPGELNHLYKDLLIGVTQFFRDPEAFARLGSEVLPALLDRVPRGEEFRAWVAGCATGEEAYSLAIQVRECLDQRGSTLPVKIFATDAHRLSLETAGTGCYDAGSLAGLAPERVERWFQRTAGGWQIVPDLRKMVVFAQHNVLKDAPFTKLDLVTCRNLLIYFQPPAQKKALSLFHFALRAGGILFLGPSETTGELAEEFESVESRWKLYRKRRDVRLPTDLRLSPAVGLPPVRTPGLQTGAPDVHLVGAYDTLLDEFMPPSILLNERREVIQTFAGANQYLHLREGRLSTDLLEMVDPELRLALTGAIPRAFKEQATVAYKHLRTVLAGQEQRIDLTVRPVRNRRGGVAHVLVQFAVQEADRFVAPPVREIDLDQASREHVLTLESELRQTKENLQAMIEELETSNEELQATNEELVAANEELQSTNEELHSVNEELHTVNAEYQRKIAELTEVTADLDNLLASTEVHTIFLDATLHIRRFTPRIGEAFHLLPQDVGRRIDNFTYTLDYPTLVADLTAVLGGAPPIERQVRDRHGHWYLLRILPYRAGLAIEGVVLTLVDLERVKAAEAATMRKTEQLAGILRNSPFPVFIKDLKGRYIVASEAFRREVGCDPIGKTVHELYPRSVAEQLARRDERVLREGVEDRAEIVAQQADGPHVYLSLKFPIHGETGQVIGVGGMRMDVTQLKEAERAAREAVGQRDQFLAMLSHELRNPLAAILNTAQLLQRGQPEAEEWIHVIERRARHMARLLDDLLDVARLAQNKIEIRKQPLDLVGLVSDVVEEVAPLLRERRLHLTQDISATPLVVAGDPTRLQQIQVNLLTNAARYTPEGGHVWYTLARQGDLALIRVRDDGIGLSADMLHRIFDLFVQAEQRQERGQGGIGVGLTLVRAIAELHGGSVEARSDGLGHGSEFLIRLPLTTARPTAIPADIPQGASAAVPILVVEDDPDLRTSMAALLQLDGYDVRTAADAAQALNCLAAGCPTIALVDIGLPGMDGYELARRIRQQFGPDRLLLVALTGYGQQADRAAARAAGFDQHLTKPFQPQELAHILRLAPGYGRATAE